MGDNELMAGVLFKKGQMSGDLNFLVCSHPESEKAGNIVLCLLYVSLSLSMCVCFCLCLCVSSLSLLNIEYQLVFFITNGI